jgi:Cd(II)/Pb(II)-responsive transcriptional regulator
MNTMRIGELAEHIGVNVETIRYYEKSGLLAPPVRSANGYRKYAASHLQRLSFIRHCRALDIPLTDVSRLLTFLDHPASDCGDINALVDEQLARVRARLTSMQALEKQLVVLRDQCTEQHATKVCGILHELVSAARATRLVN